MTFEEELGIQCKAGLIESINDIQRKGRPRQQFEMKIDHEIDDQSQYLAHLESILAGVIIHQIARLNIILPELLHQFLGLGLQIGAHGEEVYALDEIFVQEKDAETDGCEAFLEFVSGDEGDYFVAQDLFEFDHQFFEDCLDGLRE